jgi:hypothetical protein
MPKSNRAFYANQRQERNLGEAVILISQQPAKYQMCSPQFPTNKFQNGSFWFIVTFLKNANMPYEYAVFMNLCENSWRVQLPPPPPSIFAVTALLSLTLFSSSQAGAT